MSDDELSSLRLLYQMEAEAHRKTLLELRDLQKVLIELKEEIERTTEQMKDLCLSVTGHG